MSSVGKPHIIELQHVEHAASWRGDHSSTTFAYLDQEPDGKELLALQHELSNDFSAVRIISPFVLAWSQLFNPKFHAAVSQTSGPASVQSQLKNLFISDGCKPIGYNDRVSFWLQSTTFLAAVTLSAAIVQKRYSSGTLHSKYDRLWQVGLIELAGHEPFSGLNICEQVKELAQNETVSDLDRLLEIRSLYESIIERLSCEITAEKKFLSLENKKIKHPERFGFVADLVNRLGNNLECVIAYGSSISSEHYADYDVVLICKDSASALRKMYGTSPTWLGKEINIGLYDQQEFWNMQLLSGDNLIDYGVCLYGETFVPHKNEKILALRNFSFGMVRLRQQLGMLSGAVFGTECTLEDDKKNLYGYFIKIPSNIVKGTFGSMGTVVTKEYANTWLLNECGFDANHWQKEGARGNVTRALSESACATVNAMQHLNAKLGSVQAKTYDGAPETSQNVHISRRLTDSTSLPSLPSLPSLQVIA